MPKHSLYLFQNNNLVLTNLRDETCCEMCEFSFTFQNEEEENRKKHRLTGTYGYHPPEYCFGARIRYSYDIWSLGITVSY